MARALTAQDAHALMTLIARQATGQQTITVTDTSSFVSVGETVLATGMENVFNAISLVMGRTFAASRPYKAKLSTINAINTGVYTNRLRKISFYAKDALASGDWNTNLYTNLAEGYDNGSNGTSSTASMWEQHQAMPLEVNFAGQSVWEDALTRYEDQVKKAFRSEEEFNIFWSGALTEKGNDIESQKEAFNRMTLLNRIAGTFALNLDGAINLTQAYNDYFGTSYTSQQLRTTYIQSFLEFFTATFKDVSNFMTNRSKKYHVPVTKTVDGVQYSILRHTPKDKQKAILYGPLFNKAEALVFPTIFNKEYLFDPAQHEVVDFWQAEGTPAIDITPAIPNFTTGVQEAGSEVSKAYIVGVLFDEDALMIDYQLEAANTTPLEARKRYRNMWWTFSKNAINDFTENFIVFYMED